MDFEWWVAAGLFAAFLAVDALYALYTLAVTERRAVRAANLSAVMYFLLAAGVIAYTTNPLYVLPAAAGSWAGTWLAVSWPDLRQRFRGR